jgi:hypothetical protein
MSAVTIGLLVGGYVSLLVLVLCVLTAAKRGDEVAWPAEPADPAPLTGVGRQELGLALTDVDAGFVGRFNRRAFRREKVPPRLA